MARLNPFSFTPGPVIFFTTIVYVGLFAALLVTHLTVPNYPSNPPTGVNLTEAWGDLQHITRRFHPYNSHANDDVRKYLLTRIKAIVTSKDLEKGQVELFDDLTANATFSSGSTSIYFEGTNIIVAIRGSGDDEPFNATERSPDNGGVLVNAHYDSVSSGYGATDDGVGVVTILQLLSYFTESKNWPKRTVVLLLNNGEEDYLNGAKAFMRNPVSQVPHTFVNLEGAGAGGRATLFRSTDTEVTRYYKKSKYPFGTVVSGDGFKKGFIRSETDYKVFHGELGLRGLDIAFMEPRARYHTVEDSTRETSMNSLWHMLSAALASTSGLASITSDEFSGSESLDNGRVNAGTGSDGVWFDLFGRVFVVFKLHTLFALCVTLLVVAPLTLIGLTFGLSKADKNYLLARKAYIYSSDDDNPVHLYGWRGFFRFPIIFVTASAVVVALAYLIVRFNPFIVYSSPFAIWSMMLSAWISIAWFLARGADAMRPSALQRMYALIWLFVGSFVLLTLITVFVNDYQVAAGYSAMFYFAAVFAAILLSYLELFLVPTKSAYARHFEQEDESRRNSESASRPLTGSTTAARSDDRPVGDDDATETTSLLRGDRRGFARYGGNRRDSISESGEDHAQGPRRIDLGNVYPGEQEWSGKLPSWIWVVQLLLLAPIVIILVGQVALLLTSALYQTPSDGNSPLFIYLAFAALTVLLLAPTGPFIHRFTYHIPTFLFLICVATVIYNLVAFPFSRDHRLKVYFVQRVNCETGHNVVSLTGLDGYVQRIVGELPSAQGQQLNCTTPEVATRKELKQCQWQGLDAKVVPKTAQAAPLDNNTHIASWLDYSIHKGNHSNKATIRVVGHNTRACRVLFDSPITALSVDGAVSDPRFKPVGGDGAREVRLWHREFGQPWNVSVTWNAKEQSKLSGRVVCLWSDANTGDIPAFDEVQHYLPVWAIPSKISDGLVEGFKQFEI
ncbi:endoplasmic reticulum metallopeptidase 1 [Alternaria rosae]|uniref:endoplasmic reticulum metallopeptidase 1 n=1 Tax=Alternaria rosae TaxID=1187941 RepID=UPI001E8E2F8C|nr:endoplasmic reticulum metallopeptidase 1 [Alternaria rosae]KAH6868118.1 endoplasmic reticulum metallopeptidase 1 [Alternaria rosae]